MFYVLRFTLFLHQTVQLSQPYGLRPLVPRFTFYILHNYLCHTILAIMSDGTKRMLHECFTIYVLHIFLHQTVQLSQPYGLRALVPRFTFYVLHSYLCHTILAIMYDGTKRMLHACFTIYVYVCWPKEQEVIYNKAWRRFTTKVGLLFFVVLQRVYIFCMCQMDVFNISNAFAKLSVCGKGVCVTYST